ncbi:MAG: hypothetical protein WCE20_11850 [Rhizomicrobium sp.]
MTGALKTLPFENRWTSGDKAHHWYIQLEREGVESVSFQHAMHDLASESDAEATIPREFVAAWLAYHAQAKAQRTFRWRIIFLILILIGVAASLVSAWYGFRVYALMR